MSNLTPELNLNLAVDDDDTADYLTLSLSDSLTVLDGLFNAATGHAHNGSHQGGTLEFLDLTVGEDLTVIGQTELRGPALLKSNLHVMGTTTLDGATMIGSTLGVTGAVTLSSTLAAGNTAITGTLGVTGATTTLDMIVTRNSDITGNLSVHGGAQLVNTTLSGTTSLSGTITGGAVWNSGPYTTDWFRNQTVGTGVFNLAANMGVAFDATGAYLYPSADRVISAAAVQNLSNKGYINKRDFGPSGTFVTTGNDLTNYVMAYGSGTFTLPTPTAAYNGVFRAVKAYGGPATVNCGGPLYGPGTSANGAVALNNGDSVTCWSDGINWWVV